MNLTSFDSNGFSLGATSGTNQINYENDGHVAFNWKAGTSVSGNSTGAGDDVAYTGSVNTAAGFSIIRYGGNGTTGHQIPHRLGVVPDAIFIKNITTQSWNCWFPNTSMGGTKMMQLDNTGGASTQSWLNSKMPTTSVVELEAGAATNTRDGNNDPQPYIMYSFKSIEGYSKVGSYTGNNSADGVFLYLGFRPMWILVKRTDADGMNWMLFRHDDKQLEANTTSTEFSGDYIDMLSNGFKVRTQANMVNDSANYIYIAFAETPFKYSNAR